MQKRLHRIGGRYFVGFGKNIGVYSQTERQHSFPPHEGGEYPGYHGQKNLPHGDIPPQVARFPRLGQQIIQQADVAQTPAQYVRRHPGGALGKIRDNER